MPDILIRMEMPKSCSVCPFCFGANNICPWTREYATYKGRHEDCPLVELPEQTVETNLFDKEEIHTNCTVQILKNSVTGEVSVGWWSNDNKPIGTKEGN